MNKSLGRKRRDREKQSKVEATESDLGNTVLDGESNGDKEKKLSRKSKANKVIARKSKDGLNKLANEVDGDLSNKNVSEETIESKTEKREKKRRKDDRKNKAVEATANDNHREVKGVKEKKAKKKKNARQQSLALPKKGVEVHKEKVEVDYIYEMSSDDEDCSRGMKKWVTEYHQSRPGLKVLQDQIDDFITAHEAQEEEARKAREAQAADGGWTVVTHQKGRKKTTEAESGTAVGSVAPAAVMESLAKKKNNQVGLDFYRFQKREAQMSELMALRSKFEQDKKRIQQMRAARKFRPY